MRINSASILFFSFAVATALTISPSALAQAKKAQVSEPKSSDKVDISDIEQKYWAPKDVDFSVVQNRTYSKEKRYSLSAQYGLLVNDPYSDGKAMGIAANYFLSERYGVELSYISIDSEDNDATDGLSQLAAGARPNHGKVKQFYGIGFNWVPFYAKMSFLGKKIIYFDMAFTPVIGMMGYDQQLEGGNKSASAFSYGIDVTQYFFFTNHFAIRADLKNRWFSEEVLKYRTQGGVTEGDKIKDTITNTLLFQIGATYFF